MSFIQTILVVAYHITDDNEGYYQADDCTSYEDTVKYLKSLQTEDKNVTYSMFAEVDC